MTVIVGSWNGHRTGSGEHQQDGEDDGARVDPWGGRGRAAMGFLLEGR
jgi:hypothetical protein